MQYCKIYEFHYSRNENTQTSWICSVSLFHDAIKIVDTNRKLIIMVKYGITGFSFRYVTKM